MSSTEDKMKGNANEAMGKIKQGVGGAMGNERLRREGENQEIKGDAQQVKAMPRIRSRRRRPGLTGAQKKARIARAFFRLEISAPGTAACPSHRPTLRRRPAHPSSR